MGIYDRDYYRKEGPSYLGSIAMRGQMCRWLLGINIVVFFLQLLCRQSQVPFTESLELIPERVLRGEVWRLLTYAFLHNPDTWMHIVFNMWMLWLYGGYLEDLYGRWEFLAFYLTAATVGGLAYLAQALLHFNLTMNTPCLGASGAVTALMVLCAFQFPTLTILLFFVLPMPIWLMAILFVAQDVFGFLGGVPGIAFSVHLGGAAFAAAYYQSHLRIMTFWPQFRRWRLPRSRPRLRVYHGEEETREPVPVAAPPQGDVDEQLEAKVDAVLEKVARFGQQSLTDTEKQILLRASEIYKRRRS